LLPFRLPAFQYERKHTFRTQDKIKAPGPNVTGIVVHRRVLRPGRLLALHGAVLKRDVQTRMLAG
jgi:hypothetical protein